ncbi:hypothetical protein [Klenkia sp. PcliD-1-E]|uniref:hypothetical protein n=1 Tax=Klenkia sp. PcliD-1-E TaxID=2954492 RepID=UPI002097590B|nr:hypothetical protein [Klenkia sp. PcliD-1-E]
MVVLPFPPPPLGVLAALDLLQGMEGREGKAFPASAVAEMERPWEPASCTAELAAEIWAWCEDVVLWINHEFAWRPAQLVPSCWRDHPHIARELPVLAVLRWRAEASASPQPTEEWNRYAFPTFSDRMLDRLGETTCRSGRHQDWPARSRYASTVSGAAV